ncbi:cysteine protease StiP family protein [Marinobacter sp.]|uniref:cysteine protease StiP family protein n=1 Tax=Marinobacter sp. TaxID=50741 RepID=UPI001B4BD006|nr:cysteine protease StiP family protein [Marinobacter sp.]MBQ0832399.1 cysteine protease StiP family protein [Marinobacter sp.]
MTVLASLTPLHGSYQPEDCQFLLTPIEAEYFSIEEKERQIQAGLAHYSEMIHREAAPSSGYLALFETLCDRYAPRLARETRLLAQQLVTDLGYNASPITLVSLVRAGTPAGVLLRRALVGHEGQPCHHYSISIIRDRGIDTAALDYLLDQVGVDAKRIVFVDAWTAKGVITRELRSDMARYNMNRHAKGKSTIPPRLAVISDIGGTADYAATCEDYAIPSGILNATVSGLVSRSVLNHQVPTGAFHGCVLYSDLAKYDQTQAFIERVAQHLGQPTKNTTLPSGEELARQRLLMQEMLSHIQCVYDISDINHIKPGIAEATRVMLRRVPALLMVRDADHPDVKHLMLLAEEKSVPVDVCPDMPFHACSLIKALTRAEAH